MKKYAILILMNIATIIAFIITSILILNSTTKTDCEVFNQNISKVVEIRISDDGSNWGYGTGCFVSNDGLILTNKHMVLNALTNSNYAKIEVRLANEVDFISADVKKVSEDLDLALIKINKNKTKYFKTTKKINNGQTIFTIGNPNGFGLSFTKGNISSNDRNVVLENKVIKTIQTSFVINEGNSGGPVFDLNGKLLGLISFRLTDKNGDVINGVSFAIPAQLINDFIND